MRTHALLCLLLASPAAAKKPPAWVSQQPVDPAYYIGVGIASKKGEKSDYQKSAENSALSKIASQISVKISSDWLEKTAEKAGLTDVQIQSDINASAKAEIEGHEVVDSWEDKSEYWVYYRLSKAVYEENKRRKQRMAADLAVNLLSKGKTAAEPAQSLRFYVQALHALRSHLNEPVKAPVEGKEVIVSNEVYSALQSALGRLQLDVEPARLTIRSGPDAKASFTVSVRAGGKPVRDIPIRAAFAKGSGQVTEKAQTEASGKAGFEVAKLLSKEKGQAVDVKLGLLDLATLEDAGPLLQGILSTLPAPEKRVPVDLVSLKVFLSSDEKNLGKKLATRYLDPAVRKAVSESPGLSAVFVESKAEADVVIGISAATREGSVAMGLNIAYLDLDVTATSKSGVELYKGSLQSLKGVQRSFEAAGAQAYEKGMPKFKAEILPALLSGLEK